MDSSNEIFSVQDVAETKSYLAVKQLSGEPAMGVGTSDFSESVLHVQSRGGESDPILILENTGSNGGGIQFFHTTASDPENTITGDVGDVVVSSTSGQMYVKTLDSGTSNHWTSVQQIPSGSTSSSGLSIEKQTASFSANQQISLTHSEDLDDSRTVQVFCNTPRQRMTSAFEIMRVSSTITRLKNKNSSSYNCDVLFLGVF